MGPDFLCIGQQKAGTRWLYDQLNHACGVWMPPIKEIGYFNGNSFKPTNMRILRFAQRCKTLFSWERRFIDRRFCKRFERGLVSGGMTDDWYLSLFADKGDNISGDITPAYSGLGDQKVAHIAQLLPDIPIILLLRHPVERAKSALSMSVRRGRVSEEDIRSPEKTEEIISRKNFATRSFPSRIWQRWVKHFGPDRCHYFFIDDVKAQPEVVRASIARIVGLKQPEFLIDAGFNRKSNYKRFEFSEEVERMLYEFFEDEILYCRKLFKGSAVSWKTQF